jgi:hypothetical protein
MEDTQNSEIQSQSILDNQPVAAGPPDEQSVIIQKPRQKKKQRSGDFLKVEGQIKRRDALKSLVKSFKPIIQQAKARNANEADTANIVHKFFQDVLGWDFLDLTSEYKIKNTFCDLAVKHDGEIRLLIEVKAIGLNLKEEHLRQASAYAAHEGVHFVMLTNGEVYRVYHVGFGERITVALVMEVDLSSELTLDDYTELYLLSKHSLPKYQIEDYWDQQETLSRENIIEALQSEEVINALSKYFKSQYELKVDATTLKQKVAGLFW